MLRRPKVTRTLWRPKVTETWWRPKETGAGRRDDQHSWFSQPFVASTSMQTELNKYMLWQGALCVQRKQVERTQQPFLNLHCFHASWTHPQPPFPHSWLETLFLSSLPSAPFSESSAPLPSPILFEFCWKAPIRSGVDGKDWAEELSVEDFFELRLSPGNTCQSAEKQD